MGLLDGNLDPQTMQTLALAGGLLSPGSFGQGLSRGIAGSQQVGMNSLDMQAKQQAMELQKIQIAAAVRNQQLINEAIAQGLGGDQPQAAASQPSMMAGQGQLPPELSAPNNPTMGGMSPPTQPAQPRMLFGAPAAQTLPELMFNGGKGIGGMVQKYTTPESFRPGGYALAPNGSGPGQLPQVPEGFTAVRGPNGQWMMQEVPNGTSALARSSAAKAEGKAGVETQTYIGDGTNGTIKGATYTGLKRDIFPSLASPFGAPPSQVVPSAPGSTGPTFQQSSAASRAAILADMAKTGADPAQMTVNGNPIVPGAAAPVAAAAPRPVQTVLAPGVQTGADNAQNVMKDSYKSVMAANTSAQTVKARLDSIGQLAQKAILGGDTAWRDYANNLADIAGLSDRATNAKTAGDLIDKATAQIALSIGGNAQGTDALRSLAQAANPNRKMNLPAVKEATANLAAAMEVPQQKAALLTQKFNAGDAADYNNIEQNFDKNADYRIWQIAKETKGMNAGQVKAYFQSRGYTPDQIGTFLKQKSALVDMGVQF